MIPQQLNEKVTQAGPYLAALKKWVADTLAPFADARNFPVSGRIKSAESLSEKIEMGRFNHFSQIDDLVAFTLIIPTENLKQEVIDFCNASFDVVSIKDKSSTPKRPDTFRFDATRIVSRARKAADFEGPIENSIFGYLFEIQIRTAFEHAWSVATHDLVYKGPSIDWRRIRLAAQLKATSENLDASIAAFDHLAQGIIESPWSRINDQATVSEFVRKNLGSGHLPRTLSPASLSRFSENICALVKSITPEISVPQALKVIEAQLTEPASLPVSLSLYQLFLGLLSRGTTVSNVKGLTCHVTREMMTLFPETKGLGQNFDYDS